MPDPSDIEIRLKTTGDPSGAEQVQKSIFGVRDAAKQASDAADVEAVKTKQATERAVAVQKEQAASLREVADAAQRFQAARLAQDIGKITSQFKDLGPEADLAIAGVTNFLSTLANTGNPVVAILALVGTAVGSVVTAYKDASKQIEAIAKKEKEDLRNIAELRAAYAAQIRTENLTAFFQTELNALEQQEAALGRIFKIRASERELAAAQQQAAGSAAVAGGASPEGVAAQNLVVKLTNSIAGLQDSLAEATANTEKLEQDAITLTAKANLLVENSPEQKAALDAANKAVEESKTATDNLAASQTLNNNSQQQVVTQGEEAARAIADDAFARFTQTAQTEQAALKAEVDRLGTGASSNAKAALSTLAKILEDGVIKPDELAGIKDVMERIRGSREVADKTVADGFAAMEKANTALVTQIIPLVDNIGKTLDNMERLRGLQNAQGNQIQQLDNNLRNMEQRLATPQSFR